MCPQSTTKECADPLKEPNIDMEEVALSQDDETSTDEMGPIDNSEAPPALTSSLKQGDRVLKEEDGDGDEEGEEW